MAASAEEVLIFVWCLLFHSQATNQSRAPTRALKTWAPPPCRTMAAIVWTLFRRDRLWGQKRPLSAGRSLAVNGRFFLPVNSAARVLALRRAAGRASGCSLTRHQPDLGSAGSTADLRRWISCLRCSLPQAEGGGVRPESGP